MSIRIAIILGSTRPGRRGDQIASWVLSAATAHGGAEYALVDLAEHDLPNLDEPGNPSQQNYTQPKTRAWSRVIDGFDGYVFVVPEYNHSFPGALKNAIDYLYREWNNKAAGIVSYGGRVAGVRAAESLRLVLAELQLATVREQTAVAILPTFSTGQFVPTDSLRASLGEMLTQVSAWALGMQHVRGLAASR